MKHASLRVMLAVGAILALCGANRVAAQTISPEHKPAAQLVVTEEPRHGANEPAIKAEEVKVYQGHQQGEITRWTPAEGSNAGLELFLLLDDDSTSTLGSQLQDIRDFILRQPETAKVGVAYMRNGAARIEQQPTSDHKLAAKALRLPLGVRGVNASPYFSLSDLVKHWPKSDDRREVLMISDGVDGYYSTNDLYDPYLDAAIEDAQRASVVVSAIYTPGAGVYERSGWRTYWGQIYLEQVARQTGGMSYYIGFNRPAVAFAPYLTDFADRLNHQYLLAFIPEPAKNAGLEPVKVNTTKADAELFSAKMVYVQGGR